MIRLATQLETLLVRDCAYRAYERYISAIGRRPAPMDADYESLIEAKSVYIDFYESKLKGFIAFYPKQSVMFLEAVAVQPWFQGQGIGKSLIAFCEDEAKKLGLSNVNLYTNEKMTGNLIIYPKLGYIEVDRRSEDGFHRVYFEKKLLDK